jgi:cyclic nucleotide gated channel
VADRAVVVVVVVVAHAYQLMFAVLIGMMGSMMVGQKLLEEKVASQIAELREFMEAKKIPKYLRVKIRKFMETLYEEKSGFDEKEVLAQLPPAMAQDLLHHMYKKLLVDVPMFKKLEEGAITMLCSLIKPYTAMKDDTIYVKGEIGREIYIIMNGCVEISFEDGDREEIEKGQTFGEGCLRELLRKSSKKAASDLQALPREDTAIAIQDTELKFLTLQDLQLVFDDYPLVRDTMTEMYADMNKR